MSQTPNAPEDESYFSEMIEESEKPMPWYRTGPAIVGTIAAIIAVVAVLMTIVLSTDKRAVNDNTPLTTQPASRATSPTEPTPSPSESPTTAPTTEPSTEPVAPAQTSEPTYYETPTSPTYRYEIPPIPLPPAIPPIPPIPPIPQIPQIPGL
ncbi:cytoskeletal protein RodZ [Mycobacteroides chelonae]|nr:cytoskeletal protein RodZ [Mycobacteroides chelonae]